MNPFSSSLTTVVALRTWWEGAWLPYEDEMVVVSMSVREEDDSKSDTTQNLFKHSPVPPPTPPLSSAARCWDVFTPAGCLYVTAAAEKLSTVPTLSLARSQHAGSQSQDTWPSVRPPACPPPSRSGAGRRPIDAGIAVRKDGGRRGAAEERTRTDGSPLFSSTSHTCGAATGQRRRAGKRQAVRRASERASSPQC